MPVEVDPHRKNHTGAVAGCLSALEALSAVEVRPVGLAGQWQWSVAAVSGSSQCCISHRGCFGALGSEAVLGSGRGSGTGCSLPSRAPLPPVQEGFSLCSVFDDTV